VEIRSYRRVFDLERRIYRVDRLRLNPTGVPVRGIVYLLALVAAALVVSRAPLLGSLARTCPWYARDVLAPGLAATLLAVIRIDGRAFHLAARAILRFRVGPARLVRLGFGDAFAGAPVGACWTPPTLLMLPDGSEAAMRRFRYKGPGAVRLNACHLREGRGGVRSRFARRPHVIVRGAPAALGAGTCREVIVLERDARLEVR
jgi:hypothetical protein